MIWPAANLNASLRRAYTEMYGFSNPARKTGLHKRPSLLWPACESAATRVERPRGPCHHMQDGSSHAHVQLCSQSPTMTPMDYIYFVP